MKVFKFKFNPKLFIVIFIIVFSSIALQKLATVSFFKGFIVHVSKKVDFEDIQNNITHHYTIYTHELGKGSYSEVLLAKDRDNNEWLAVKIQPFTEPEDIQHEIKHLSIIGDYRGDLVSTHNGKEMHFLFSILAPGVSVDILLKNHNPLSQNETLDIILSSFYALQSLHRINMIHNDIHEGNLVYNPKDKTSHWVDMAFSLKLDPNERYMKVKMDPNKPPPYHKAHESNRYRGYASDIYQLGFMSQKILSHSQSTSPPIQISNLLRQMMDPDMEKRPTIQEAIQILEKYRST